MNAMRARRNLAPRPPGSVAHQASQTSLAGGNLFIEEIHVPSDPVAPGGTVRVEVTVANEALLILNDPNGCDSAAGSPEWLGYLVRLVADPEWGAPATPETCLHTEIVGPGRWSQELTFTAPQAEGFHDITFGLEFPNTGEASGTVARTIEVAAEGDPSPDPNGGNGGNGDGDGGDDGSLFDQARTLGIVVAVILALLLANNLAG